MHLGTRLTAQNQAKDKNNIPGGQAWAPWHLAHWHMALGHSGIWVLGHMAPWHLAHITEVEHL